jgi:hypothetical protein
LNGAQGRRVRRYVSPSTLLRRPPQQLVYPRPSSFKIRASLWGVASFRVIRKSPCQHSRQHLAVARVANQVGETIDVSCGQAGRAGTSMDFARPRNPRS